jgi:hypothetical protein
VSLARAVGVGRPDVAPEAWDALARVDLEPTTCWDFPDQGPVASQFGDSRFNGVTPSACVVNLVRRFTAPGDIVLDPMAGSGTVGDVARSLGRRAVSLDLAVRRPDLVRGDARACPVRGDVAALAIVDSPYSDNVAYSEDPRCLGRISCQETRFYDEMARVAEELHRVLRTGGVLAWIISDEYRGGAYTPVSFRLWQRLIVWFHPIDTIALVRHHDRSGSPMWEHRARRYNFFLRGFKFLFLMRKPREAGRSVHARRVGAYE